MLIISYQGIFGGLEKDLLVLVNKKRKLLIWRWCTWWQPWFPRTRRAWRAHRAEEAWQRSGSREKWWCFSCCSGQDGWPRQRYARRCRSRKSSWWTWPLRRYRCRGAPASTPCRCRCCRIPFVSSFSSCRRSERPWLCRPSWRLWMKPWVAWCELDEVTVETDSGPTEKILYKQRAPKTVRNLYRGSASPPISVRWIVIGAHRLLAFGVVSFIRIFRRLATSFVLHSSNVKQL